MNKLRYLASVNVSCYSGAGYPEKVSKREALAGCNGTWSSYADE